MKPLAVDLFCGLGGWTDGLLAEGFDVIGFDIERHEYGEHRYPGQLVIQDVTTLHGSQFCEASLLVASPPCQKYSYMAMPWKRSKAMAAAIRADETGKMLADLNCLFDACFRIQREACEAAGRHIPLIVENVRGAQKWVGRARWNFGSFYLWGDVPALMPMTLKATKVPGLNWSGSDKPGYVARGFNTTADQRVRDGLPARTVGATPAEDRGLKCCGGWFGDDNPSAMRLHNSKSPARKMASAMIAKIPPPLARHIAVTFRPKIPEYYGQDDFAKSLELTQQSGPKWRLAWPKEAECEE